MDNQKRKQSWWEKMVARYGSEDAVRAEMQRRQAKSRETYTGSGGFAHMRQSDPERFIEISSKGGSRSVKK